METAASNVTVPFSDPNVRDSRATVSKELATLRHQIEVMKESKLQASESNALWCI